MSEIITKLKKKVKQWRAEAKALHARSEEAFEMNSERLRVDYLAQALTLESCAKQLERLLNRKPTQRKKAA